MVSWCKMGPIMLRSSSIITEVRQNLRCINKSLLSHYNSLCFCKLFLPESPQVHSHIPKHCATYWLNFNLNTTTSWSFCMSQSSEADMSDLTCYLSQNMLYNDKYDKKMSLWNKHLTNVWSCLSLCCSWPVAGCLSLVVLWNRFQSLLSFWQVFSPIMTGLVMSWNRPLVFPLWWLSLLAGLLYVPGCVPYFLMLISTLIFKKTKCCH